MWTVCVWGCEQRSLPVQLEGQSPVDGGEAEQADPSQQDAAEYAGLEVENHHLWADTGEPGLRLELLLCLSCQSFTRQTLTGHHGFPPLTFEPRTKI